MEVNQTRTIDRFFHDALDDVIRTRHKKSLFLMTGGVRYGKTSNFTLGAPYKLAHKVVPIKQGKDMVRESLWFGIRESENSAVSTFKEAIADSIFSPEILVSENSPVTFYGNHPRFIKIEHGLEDGTILRMIIECHGFNNPMAEDRLRSRSCLGVMIPEIQGVPEAVVDTAIERAGTWRPETCRIEYELDDEKILISGASELKMVFCDINVPERPHYIYPKIFDNDNIESSGYMLIQAPHIVIPKLLSDIPPSKEISDIYPRTKFRGDEVVWLPNPKAYNMTRHWERLDPDGNKIPWTGYEQWYSKINISTESQINRLVLGEPNSVGGMASVYPNFDKHFHVAEKPFSPYANIYVGYDIGKNSGFTFFQIHDQDIHIFNELYFTTNDSLSTRSQIENFLVPLIRGEYKENNVHICFDPAGKHSSSLGESAETILKEYNLNLISLRKYAITNQNIEQRKSCLEFFIDSRRITIDPSCSFIIKALSGGFCYTSNRAGVISNMVDKYNPYSHIAESAQYISIVLYKKLIKAVKNGTSKTKFTRIRSS